MSYTLTIPRQRDPVARGVLLACTVGALWLGVARPGEQPAPAQAEPLAQQIIIVATPALPLPSPTAVPAPTAAPVEALAAQTNAGIAKLDVW